MYSSMMSNMAQSIQSHNYQPDQLQQQPKAKPKTFHPFSIASILGNAETSLKPTAYRQEQPESTYKSTPKPTAYNQPQHDTTIIVDNSMPAPLQASTPVPVDQYSYRQYHSEDNNTTPFSRYHQRVEIDATPVRHHHNNGDYTPSAFNSDFKPAMYKNFKSPEEALPTAPPAHEAGNNSRVEKWVMENCVTGNLSPESTRRDILAESFALALSGNTGSNTDTETSSNVSKPVENQLNHHQQQPDQETSSGYSGNNTASSSPEPIHDQSFTTSESTSRPGSPDSERRRAKKARTSFTASQLCDLETHYRTHRYISAADRIKLARKLKLSDQQVKTWYQNRRMKEKRQVQDFEHAQKFHQTGAMLAAAAAVGGSPHPLVSYPAVTLATTMAPPAQAIATPPTRSLPAYHHHQQQQMADYYSQQPSFTQLLHDSPPGAPRMMLTSVPQMFHHQQQLSTTLGHISALPLPSTGDIRAVASHYGAPMVGQHPSMAPGHISAFTRVGASVVPVSLPSHIVGRLQC